jgi:hypothetical protein
MKFVNVLFGWLGDLGEMIGNAFEGLFRFLEKPLSLLFSFFDGIFYFFTVVFDIVVKVIMVFVALFQFVFALIVGFLRTLQDLLTPSFKSVNMPSDTQTGFNAVLDVVDPVGVLNIIPYIAIALVWSGFIYKLLALFGGTVTSKGGG